MEDNEVKEKLEKKIEDWRNERGSAQKRWSAVHHFCLFGSILCSVAAGTIIQISKDLSTLATTLTSIAAVLTAIAASGGFERKWRSNRLSRSKGDLLLIDLDTESPNLKKIRKGFKTAIEKHDLEVVGDEQEKNEATDANDG